MRKVERFEAHLDDYNSITVYLSKRFYQGKSESFFLREPSGKLSKLVIKSFENTSNEYSKYMLAGCENILFGVPYEVVEEHSLSTPLQIGLIVKSPRFDQEFYYPGNDLGAQTNGDVTEFVLWAPTAVAVKLQIDTDIRITLDLKREEKGIYRISIPQNLHLAKYIYLILVNGKWIESIDPYGRSSTSNSTVSVVIDDHQCTVDQRDDCLPLNVPG